MADSFDPRSGPPNAGHWPAVARLWKYVGPPLRPSPEELELYQEAIDRWHAREGRAPKALILGVTPELYRLRWPAGSTVRALDRAQAMIDWVWPGPREDARCGDWTELRELETDSDLVLCDGGFALLSYPDRQAELARTLGRAVRQGGRCVLRLFAPPQGPREGVEQVVRDLDAGRVPSLDALKLRLWVSLQRSVEEGVRPAQVLRVVSELSNGDLTGFARRHGFSPEHVLALSAHRDSPATYHLSGPREVERLFGDAGGFSLVAVRCAPTALGACCPVVVLDRR